MVDWPLVLVSVELNQQNYCSADQANFADGIADDNCDELLVVVVVVVAIGQVAVAALAIESNHNFTEQMINV